MVPGRDRRRWGGVWVGEVGRGGAGDVDDGGDGDRGQFANWGEVQHDPRGDAVVRVRLLSGLKRRRGGSSDSILIALTVRAYTAAK